MAEPIAGRVERSAKEYIESEAARLDLSTSEVVARILEEHAEAGRRLDTDSRPGHLLEGIEERVGTLEGQVEELQEQVGFLYQNASID